MLLILRVNWLEKLCKIQETSDFSAGDDGHSLHFPRLALIMIPGCNDTVAANPGLRGRHTSACEYSQPCHEPVTVGLYKENTAGAPPTKWETLGAPAPMWKRSTFS